MSRPSVQVGFILSVLWVDILAPLPMLGCHSSYRLDPLVAPVVAATSAVHPMPLSVQECALSLTAPKTSPAQGAQEGTCSHSRCSLCALVPSASACPVEHCQVQIPGACRRVWRPPVLSCVPCSDSVCECPRALPVTWSFTRLLFTWPVLSSALSGLGFAGTAECWVSLAVLHPLRVHTQFLFMSIFACFAPLALAFCFLISSLPSSG